MPVTYLRRMDRPGVGTYGDCTDYIFRVQGYQTETVCVGITGAWHETIPDLDWKGTEEELSAIAKEFLEKNLLEGWKPTSANNRLEIQSTQMECRLREGIFSTPS